MVSTRLLYWNNGRSMSPKNRRFVLIPIHVECLTRVGCALIESLGGTVINTGLGPEQMGCLRVHMIIVQLYAR